MTLSTNALTSAATYLRTISSMSAQCVIAVEANGLAFLTLRRGDLGTVVTIGPVAAGRTGGRCDREATPALIGMEGRVKQVAQDQYSPIKRLLLLLAAVIVTFALFTTPYFSGDGRVLVAILAALGAAVVVEEHLRKRT